MCQTDTQPSSLHCAMMCHFLTLVNSFVTEAAVLTTVVMKELKLCMSASQEEGSRAEVIRVQE